MLNIISRSVYNTEIRGPKKVVDNLIQGLDILGYPYCINKDLSATSQVWIHDDPIAFQKASQLGLKAIAGPNVYMHIPKNINVHNFVYLQPSPTTVSFWHDFGFNRCPLEAWPVGIDTKEFYEREKPTSGTVLIYFKERYPEELAFVKNILETSHIKYEIITYGSYVQKEYGEKLKNTKYIIWIGISESQGIGLEEALAMNVPILVWDVLNLGQRSEATKKSLSKEELEYTNVSSAYYFDNRCGIKTKEKEKIAEFVSEMEREWRKFEPRKYILENLSCEKQAKALIELFDKYYSISYETGAAESLRSEKKWRNNAWYFRSYVWIREHAKKIIRQ